MIFAERHRACFEGARKSLTICVFQFVIQFVIALSLSWTFLGFLLIRYRSSPVCAVELSAGWLVVQVARPRLGNSERLLAIGELVISFGPQRL